MSKIKKITIFGGPGTGKTRLADILSDMFNLPVYHLDAFQFENDWKPRPKDVRDAKILETVEKDSWIIEGVYYAWVTESFQMADFIYVLDLPSYIYKYRIIIRFIKRKFGLGTGKKESLKSLYNLLKWTNQFQNKNLKEIAKILEKYDNKVVWISGSREIDEIILNE